MTDAALAFLEALRAHGYDFVAGVPCSLLATLISAFEADRSWGYVPAVREDSACALAVGGWMGGRRPIVLMQNSGLGVSVNALASLSKLYECPTLLIVSWRGEGGREGVPVGSTSAAGFVDADEHLEMGEITPRLLDLLGISWRLLDPRNAAEQLTEVTRIMERTSRPVALLVRKGIFDRAHGASGAARCNDAPAARPAQVQGMPSASPERMPRIDAARTVLRHAGDDTLIVACNGMIGRELWTIGDRPSYFYMIGSMGLASSIALGLALAQPARRVVCLDGDGNVLMGLAALASVGAAQPARLYHVCLDNEAHGSTGDQATISDGVQLEQVAAACGYHRSMRADGRALAHAAQSLFEDAGPAFLLTKVERGNVAGIGRVSLSPAHLARRMRQTVLR